MDYNDQEELPSCALMPRDQNVQRHQLATCCRLSLTSYGVNESYHRPTSRYVSSLQLRYLRSRASILEQALRRRRYPTYAQRRAANLRERRRMVNLKEAFKDLRDCLPTFSYERKLSRIETLRLAIMYISFLKEILNGKKPEEIMLNNNKMTSTTEKTGEPVSEL